jgi:deoxyribonuclease-4
VLVGAHCRGGVKGAVDHALEIEADAVQLFAQSPRTWRFPDHDPADLAAFRTRREEAGLGAVLVHALYLVNLASPNEDVYAKSVETLVKTVDAACAIEADGVVLHVGSHQGAGFEAGLERVLPAMELALERCSGPTWLLVENTAGAGGTIGRSVEELAAIVERLGRHPRLGVCLDSCHLYASGYDVTDPETLDRLLDELDAGIGLDRLRCVHVNDSKAPLGSNRDRHDVLLEGLMGERLGVFLGHPRLQHLPAVLETGTVGGGPGAEDIRVARELHARWAAATRPGGRGRVRGTRARRRAARRTRD